MNKIESVTVHFTAPVNIAVVKYWGKRDDKLILPVNSSLSLTLSQDALHSSTIVEVSNIKKQDRFTLNGEIIHIEDNSRIKNLLILMRNRAQDLIIDGKLIISKKDWPNYRLDINSENNFPTAAGLASSASGFACLTSCLSFLYGFKEEFPGELTTIARQGSGSACRSLFGGFVKWEMGQLENGHDSISTQIASHEHWEYLAVNDNKKKISSTIGMQDSVNTSLFLNHRAKEIVPTRMNLMEKAILDRNFSIFGELTMKDSNNFHSSCIDTYPPIHYLNDTSFRIIDIIHELNNEFKQIQAAYTFDAGPNPVVFTLKCNLSKVLDKIASSLSSKSEENTTVSNDFLYDPLHLCSDWQYSIYKDIVGIKKIIISKIGSGPILKSFYIK